MSIKIQHLWLQLQYTVVRCIIFNKEKIDTYPQLSECKFHIMNNIYTVHPLFGHIWQCGSFEILYTQMSLNMWKIKIGLQKF